MTTLQSKSFKKVIRHKPTGKLLLIYSVDAYYGDLVEEIELASLFPVSDDSTIDEHLDGVYPACDEVRQSTAEDYEFAYITVKYSLT